MKSFLFVLFVLFVAAIAVPGSQAATVMYSDASAWQAAMGAGKWQFVDETQILTGFTPLPGNTLSLPLGKSLTFDSGTPLYGLQVPDEWATWSGGNTPKVLYTNGATSVTGTFSAPMYAFGIEAEPSFDIHNITLTLSNNSVLTQSVDANGGAQFYGWIGTDAITAMTISSDADFAIGREGAPVPDPGTLLLLVPSVVGLFGIRRKIKE